MRRNHSVLKIATVLLAFFAFAASTIKVAPSSVSKSPALKSPLALENAINPDEYDSASGSELVPKIVSCTATSLSRRIAVQFESKVINAFYSRDGDVGYVIDDPNYTGERSDPFKVPQENNILSGYTYRADAGIGQTALYISNNMTCGTRFEIKNLRIASGAMYLEKEYDVSLQKEVIIHDSYQDLETIYICDGVETVESGAIVNVPDSVTIKCVAPSKPSGWADDWTDATNVLWGQELEDTSKATVKQSGSTKSYGQAEDYILGYKGSEQYQFGAYPLTLSYEKILADGSRTTEYQEIPVKHQTNPYDAVGSTIYGNTNTIEITVNINKGEDIDAESFEFYNIFKAQRFNVDEKKEWPVDAVNTVLNKYNVPETIEEINASFIPSLDGNTYFHQLYEGDNDDYLTIASEFNTKEEADALLATYQQKITDFVVEKSVFQTEDDLKYTLLPEYNADKYGSVYNLFLKQQEKDPVNIFIQAYVVHNERIDKYEFVTYIILDRPVAEEIENEGVVEVVYNKNSRSLPFSALQIAVRPFVFVPDFVRNAEDTMNVPKEKLKASCLSRFKKTVWINDIISTKYATASKFLNYTSLCMKADKVLDTIYAGYIGSGTALKVLVRGEDGRYYNGEDAYDAENVRITGSFKAPRIYIEDTSSRKAVENNILSILNNKYVFRYTVSNLNLANLVVTYKKGGVEYGPINIPIKSPSPVFEISQDKDNILSFLVNNDYLKGIDTGSITAVGISGATVDIHLFNNETHTRVMNTQLQHTFGNIEILPHINVKLNFFDINAFLLLFLGALTLIYAIIAIVLFFYKKNKFKNDEFRRMNAKAYIKSAILGYTGLVLILAAISFVVLRIAFFNSTIPTYNPIDAFVIMFVIAAAISLGLFIKNFASAIKVARKRREILRLKLDKDVVDDGTK